MNPAMTNVLDIYRNSPSRTHRGSGLRLVRAQLAVDCYLPIGCPQTREHELHAIDSAGRQLSVKVAAKTQILRVALPSGVIITHDLLFDPADRIRDTIAGGIEMLYEEPSPVDKAFHVAREIAESAGILDFISPSHLLPAIGAFSGYGVCVELTATQGRDRHGGPLWNAFVQADHETTLNSEVDRAWIELRLVDVMQGAATEHRAKRAQHRQSLQRRQDGPSPRTERSAS